MVPFLGQMYYCVWLVRQTVVEYSDLCRISLFLLRVLWPHQKCSHFFFTADGSAAVWQRMNGEILWVQRAFSLRRATPALGIGHTAISSDWWHQYFGFLVAVSLSTWHIFDMKSFFVIIMTEYKKKFRERVSEWERDIAVISRQQTTTTNNISVG